MTDFTKTLTTTQDFTSGDEYFANRLQSEDRALGESEAGMMTTFAQALFEDDTVAVTTDSDIKELNEMIREDVLAMSKEADVEAVSEMVATGDVRDPQQASALLQSLEQDQEPVGENTALLSTAVGKLSAQAIEDGDIIPEQDIRSTEEYKQAHAELSKNFYSDPADIAAKQAVFQQILAEVEEEQSNAAAVGAFVVDLIPGATAVRSYKGTISDTSWGFLTNRTYEDVLAADELFTNPSVSPEDVYRFLQEYRQQHDPETVKQKLRSILNRSYVADQAFFALDFLTAGASVGTAVGAAGKTAVLAGKAVGASSGAIGKAILKEGSKAAARALASEIPGLKTVTYSVVDISKNPGKITKLVGGRKKFAESIAEGVPKAAFESAKTSEKIIEEAVETAVSPRLTVETTTQVSNKPVVASAKEAVAAREKLQERMWARAGKLKEMSETELGKLQEQATENFLLTHPGAKITHADLEQFDVSPIKHDKQSGKTVYTFRYKIGTGANNADAFATKEAAEEYAKGLKIKGSSNIVEEYITKDKTGWWVIFDTQSTDSLADLTTEALTSQATHRGLKVSEQATKGKLGSSIQGVSARSTVERRLSALAAHERDNVMLPLLLDAHRSIKSLNRRDGAILDTLIDQSRRQKQWISTEWMREQGLSENLINAYANYRAINDLDYLVANRELARELINKGARNVSFDGKRQGYEFLKEADESDRLDNLWFKVDGSAEARKLTPEEYKELRKKGYRFTETPYSEGDIPASRIRKAYAPGRYSDTSIKESDMIVNYVAGGRHKYSDSNIFIKQLEILEGTPTKTGSGRKYISGVKTITAGTSIDDANMFAELLEDARKIWIGFKNNQVSPQTATLQLQNGLGRHVSWGGTIESLDAWMTEHKISRDPDAVIEAVRDGAKLKSYDTIMNRSIAEDLIDSDEAFRRSASNLLTNEHSILKRMRTEGDIEEIFEGFTPVRANPEEEIKRLVNDITNMTTMKAYSDMYRENFQRVYGDMIRDLNGKPFKLDVSVLKSKNEVADKDKWQAAFNAIRQYETIRGTTNAFDDMMLEIFDGVLRTLHVSEDGIQKIHDAKLLPLARRVESFFNFAFAPAQLLRQAMGIASTHLLNPLAAAQADVMMFLYPIFKDGTPKMIEAGLKAVGLEDASEALGTFFKNVDILRSKGTYYEAGVIEGGLSMSRTFTKAGYLPYITGETINRVHSSIVTLLSSSSNRFLGTTAATFKNRFASTSLDEVAPEEFAELVNRYQTYYRNMDAVGKAPIQNSQVYQTVLQFQSYRLKWWETLMDEELTKTQKGAFILGNILLYGSSGNGLGNVTAGLFEDNTTAGRIVNDGFLNYAMQALFGDEEYLPDLNELGSASPFDIFGYGLHLGENLASVPILRSSSQVVNTVSRITDAAVAVYKDPDYSYGAFLKDMKLWVSSSDNPFVGPARMARAAEAFLTGYLKNSSGVLSADQMNDVSTILYALGFNNLRDSQLWRKIQQRGQEKADVNEIIKDLKPFYLEMINNPADNKAREAWKRAAKLFTEGLTTRETVEINQGLARELRNRHKGSLEKYKEAELNRLGYDPHSKIVK